jgi:hypothetical protein
MAVVRVVVVRSQLTWSGATLLTYAWLRHPGRPSLAEQLGPFPSSVADEAQVWLDRQT